MDPLYYIDSQDKNNFRIMRIVCLILQFVLSIMVVVFSKQALHYARAMREHLDIYTKLTFIFLGLFFVSYYLYTVSLNISLLDGAIDSYFIQTILWLLNILFYMFKNLALFFNLSKWGFAIHIMDPQVGYHKVEIAPKQKAIAAFLVLSSLGFYVAELSLN